MEDDVPKGHIKKLPDDLAGIIPTYGPDPRQEQLFQDVEADEKLLANVGRGFAASSADLGYLQWMAMAAARKGLAYKDALKAVVGTCVQRVESMTINPNKDDEHEFDVRFVTHDDCGRYIYTFTVDFNGSYDIPSIVYRQINMDKKETEEDDDE